MGMLLLSLIFLFLCLFVADDHKANQDRGNAKCKEQKAILNENFYQWMLLRKHRSIALEPHQKSRIVQPCSPSNLVELLLRKMATSTGVISADNSLPVCG